MPVTAEAGPFEREKIDALFAALKAEKWQPATSDPGAVSRSGPALEYCRMTIRFTLSIVPNKDGKSSVRLECGLGPFAKVGFGFMTLFMIAFFTFWYTLLFAMIEKSGFEPMLILFLAAPVFIIVFGIAMAPLSTLQPASAFLIRLAHRLPPEHSPMLISLSRNLKCGKPLIDKLYQKFLVASSR